MTNKLAQSTSPYLQQHADNPVHWQEWGPEALAEARDSGKPILLSVGYSACHWCHVMAHESFEDNGIAALMNALFVNIKVDREERPDIDQIYQTAHAMLTQRSGGWPLTMFLTADTAPFFGGTYFPKTARYGLPGFGDLLQRVARYHREQGEDIHAQNAQLLQALNARTSATAQAADGEPMREPGREPIEAAFLQMADSFDQRFGGFGHAPKFPHPEMIEFCLRRAAATDSAVDNAADRQDARHIACFTLRKMCEGGIFDQLGGGFARYSVDGEWAIPHFEKMLYDNGPLLRLLTDARLVAEDETQRLLFGRCVEDTVGWVLREMQSSAGGYYSTIDADAEGHEGKFTVWTREEVQALLTEAEWRVAAPHYGFDRAANFEEKFWNPVIAKPLGAIDAELGEPAGSGAIHLASAKQALFQAREQRIHPGRDDKILVSWNALMIEGISHAARVFDTPLWLASARRALQFVRTALWNDQTKRLFATHRDGRSHLNAYLDDYAYLVKALIAIMQADFHPGDLAFARELADVLLDQFEDRSRGGFFFTSHDHEPLIQRPKPGFDNATPSGNGVAALALLRLTHLTGELKYEQAARRTLACFATAMEEHPSGHGSLLMALEEVLAPPRLLLLTGPESGRRAWRAALAKTYRPDLITLSLPPEQGLPAVLTRPAGDVVNAYLCQGVTCLPPIADLGQLQTVLKHPIVRAA